MARKIALTRYYSENGIELVEELIFEYDEEGSSRSVELKGIEGRWLFSSWSNATFDMQKFLEDNGKFDSKGNLLSIRIEDGSKYLDPVNLPSRKGITESTKEKYIAYNSGRTEID